MAHKDLEIILVELDSELESYLVWCSGITPSGAWETYVVLGTEPRAFNTR